MLTFIGLGLYDERDISVKGLDAVASADRVYAEFYTSRLMGTTLTRLEEFYGKKVHQLSRSEVEVDPAWLEEARDLNVAFLVGGDAMVSTTHLDLRLRAVGMGIKTRVIHSSSIVTAVSGLSGLQKRALCLQTFDFFFLFAERFNVQVVLIFFFILLSA